MTPSNTKSQQKEDFTPDLRDFNHGASAGKQQGRLEDPPGILGEEQLHQSRQSLSTSTNAIDRSREGSSDGTPSTKQHEPCAPQDASPQTRRIPYEDDLHSKTEKCTREQPQSTRPEPVAQSGGRDSIASGVTSFSDQSRSTKTHEKPIRRCQSDQVLSSKSTPLSSRNASGLQVMARAAQSQLPTTGAREISRRTTSVPRSVNLPSTVGHNVYQGPTIPKQSKKEPVTISPPTGPHDSPVGHHISVMPPMSSPLPSHSKPKPTTALRRGKWTVEEEAYVARVIQDFNSGYLNAPAGTTLRSYLSEKLHCDPMRITKKFTGDACIGKRVFHPAVRCPSNTAAIDKAQAELDALERRWRRKLEMQQRETAKKAAASAAAAAAAASGRSHLNTSSHLQAGSLRTVSAKPVGLAPSPHLKHTAVTRTASWLDRANAILSGQTGEVHNGNGAGLSYPGQRDHAQAVKSLPTKEIEDQMKEVQRLIHEGPSIQQTTAGLPHLLDYRNIDQPDHRSDHYSPNSSPPPEPRDKRPRRLSGAEDAEALVGFLNSVRASAAAAAAAGDSLSG